MKEKDYGTDFITIDGGEGGTGAAPPSFADHVSVPWIYGFGQVYRIFKKYNLNHRIVCIGSGKLGLPAKAAWPWLWGAKLSRWGEKARVSIEESKHKEVIEKKSPLAEVKKK